MTVLYIKTVTSNIDKLEHLEAINQLDLKLALKLSVLEGGGWIEEKMNYIIFCHLENQIKNKNLKDSIKSTVRKRSYGFTYDDFRNKLLYILNEVELRRMEDVINLKYPAGLPHFKSQLKKFYKERSSKAHTYTKKDPATSISMGFSDIKITLKEINDVFSIIKKFVDRL